MFDHVEIRVRGGDGGDGCISFLREKFMPMGGPAGGDGGKGGDVVIKADASVSSLHNFRSRQFYRADSGKNGMGKKMHGKNGEERLLMVPPGTIVSEVADSGEEIIADLAQPGQQVIVAKGGKGGLGNIHYVSSVHQAPMIAQAGEPGEEKTIRLEMRLIADVGIIGYPNVGKSSLLAAASAAHPKVANYPFTTLEPMLGVVEVGIKTFVLADMPGLIEDAHLGRGLGHDFLRHIMRTRVLIHLIDGRSADPVADMKRVNRELALFDAALAQKPQIVGVNKIDLPEVQAKADEIKTAFYTIGIQPFLISAATKQGVPELMTEALRLLTKLGTVEKPVEAPVKVFRPQPREGRFQIRKKGEIFVVEAPEMGRLISKDGTVSAELRWHLKQQFARRGIARQLEKAGIHAGDTVRCGEVEFEW